MSEFNTIHELYKHIHPALTARKQELRRQNIITTEEDIFLKLSELKWKKATNLTIATIISDILNITEEELNDEGESNNEEK